MFNLFLLMANTSTKVWDQIMLFDQLTLCDILNGHEDLGTAELRAAVAALTNEQWDDTVCSSCMRLRSWLGCQIAKVYRL